MSKKTAETKPCLEDGSSNPADADTCSNCGGGSFQHVLDQEVRHAAILAQRELDAADPNHVARQSADDLPQTLEEARARFAAGWRPDSMCAECTSLDTPCKACWVRAGYSADAYSGPSDPVAPPLPPLPEGAYGADSLPVPRHPDLGGDGSLSSPSDDLAASPLPPPAATPVIAQPPSYVEDSPTAHDGDDPGPTTQPEVDAHVDPLTGDAGGNTTKDETPKAKAKLPSGKKGGGK